MLPEFPYVLKASAQRLPRAKAWRRTGGESEAMGDLPAYAPRAARRWMRSWMGGWVLTMLLARASAFLMG